MATLDSPAPVNLVRSIFLCNIFNFFFSASKASLIPFITVYLKMLGLSASQTGLIIGLKTAVSLVFAPLWARCAVRCGRRRCMLMFSLFVMTATYLSLSAVPSMDEHAFTSRCHPGHGSININISKTPAAESKANFTSEAPVMKSTTQRPKTTTMSGSLSSNTEENGANPTLSNNTSDSTEKENKTEVTHKSESSVTTMKPTTQSSKTFVSTETSEDDQELVEMLRLVLETMGIEKKDLQGADKAQLEQALSDVLDSKDGDKLMADALSKLPDDVQMKLFKVLSKEADQGERKKRQSGVDASHTESPSDDKSESYFSYIYIKMKAIQQHMRDTENQVFIVVMLILMVGEAFCAPVEKIADDGWFEFLESIDDLEKYGMQRIWSTFAYILFPVIVTVSVDNTSCVFGMAVHPFYLHFYMFGILLGITFLISVFYPMATSDKYKYASKVGKGMRVICCNGRSFMFVVTLLLLGMIYASYYNFLFWQLLDMGSREATLGLCMMMAALSEIPMLLFSEKLVKKIGNGGVVSISLLLVGVRCIYYSYLPTPWAVIPAELTHAFTHTALWWAILSSQVFNTSPALSRSIRSILSTVYFGVGFAVGSIVSGVVYDIYGAQLLFLAGAVVAFGWFPFLCVGVRCCREKDKSEIKYTRLLASDDASDDTDSMEDDWLEQALKDK